jgi:cyclase
MSGDLLPLARGVYAYLQLPGNWGVNNVGVVHDGGDLLLVDTTQTPGRTAALQSALSTLSDDPVRTIVNTHHHGDHTFGNYLFPGATIVGHRRCRDEMLRRGLDSVVFPDQHLQLDGVRIEAPTILFEDRVDIVVGTSICQLSHLGRTAHTTNDIVALLPEQGVLFAGDLAFNGSTPFALAGSVGGSVQVCDELAGVPADVVVPGHGRVTTPAVFTLVADYYRLVQERAAEALRHGDDPLRTAQRTDLGSFADWLAPERLVANIAVAMAEQSSDYSFDPAAIVSAMIAFNGGRPLEHAHP